MKIKIVIWLGITLLSLFSAVLFQSINVFDFSITKLTIPPGSSARSVQAILEEHEILPPRSSFLMLVRLFRLQDRLRAGDYNFSPSDSLLKIILKLTQGKTLPPKQLRVTFPEGTSIYKMGLSLKDAGFSNWAEFQALVNEGITGGLRSNHWKIFKYVPSESLEGYLFPDTYQFYADASVEAVAEIMLKRFEAVVIPFWEGSKQDTKLNLHEILTLASIIEKEARVPSEREIIASVFYNRLKIGMPLAADPTIKYALERPTKKVFVDQLSVKSPYNTYKRRGLPPGPICNPGLDSIKAAVYPAKTDYLFFVAKPDGSHTFSKTWQEHQVARGKVLLNNPR